MIAQVMDVKTAEVALGHVERQPMIAVVICLAAIVGVGLFVAVYYIKVIRPQELAARALERKERAERHMAERAERKEEKAADRQLYKDIAVAAIAKAADSAQLSITDAHKLIGDRVAGVKDDVSAAHETSKKIQQSVKDIMIKLGIAMMILGLIGLMSGCVTLNDQTKLTDQVVQWAAKCTTERTAKVASDCHGQICTVIDGPVCATAKMCSAAAAPVILGVSPTPAQLSYAQGKCK